MEVWPFDDPKNVATVTTRHVVLERQPILMVSHDAEDGCWQFHTGGPFKMADALLVSLEHVFRLDASIGELADLPRGWTACREAPGKPWLREPAECS